LFDRSIGRFEILSNGKLHHSLGAFGRMPQVWVIDQLMEIALGHRVVEIETRGDGKLSKISSGDETHPMPSALEPLP